MSKDKHVLLQIDCKGSENFQNKGMIDNIYYNITAAEDFEMKTSYSLSKSSFCR